MNVQINSDRLRIETLARGWNMTQLAERAGVSRATVTAAFRGEAISTHSLKRIAGALAAKPPMSGIDGLI